MLDKKDKELLRLLQHDCTLCLQDWQRLSI